MISSQNRFHGPNAVRRLRGANFHTDLLSARAAKNPKRDDYRLAVVVSKKTASKAVARNRIRRRIFELIRTQERLSGLPIDCVIYVKSADVATAPASTLSEEVAALTEKILARVLN